MSIDVRHLCKRFNHHVALDDVSFTVRERELLALLGPSGSGKTTLLRVIAGLERADPGIVLFDGADPARWNPRDRGVGFRLPALRPVPPHDGRRAFRHVVRREFDRRLLQVELGRDQYERVGATVGERVYLKPRRIRVFMQGRHPARGGSEDPRPQ
jgi:ABC-type taurine transport system ATPase subunit